MSLAFAEEVRCEFTEPGRRAKHKGRELKSGRLPTGFHKAIPARYYQRCAAQWWLHAYPAKPAISDPR